MLLGIHDHCSPYLASEVSIMAVVLSSFQETSNIMKEKIFNIYLKSQKKLSIKKFRNDFEIISVLRNLKIIGIFTRLAIRDNKKDYLKLIPYTWSLIRLRLKNNEIFNSLNILLDKNFTK